MVIVYLLVFVYFRVSFGTTKYCSNFLKGAPCPKTVSLIVVIIIVIKPWVSQFKLLRHITSIVVNIFTTNLLTNTSQTNKQTNKQFKKLAAPALGFQTRHI